MKQVQEGFHFRWFKTIEIDATFPIVNAIFLTLLNKILSYFVHDENIK